MFENMTVQVGWDTTNEQIDELEKRINNWLSQDDKRDLASSTAIMVRRAPAAVAFRRSGPDRLCSSSPSSSTKRSTSSGR